MREKVKGKLKLSFFQELSGNRLNCSRPVCKEIQAIYGKTAVEWERHTWSETGTKQGGN